MLDLAKALRDWDEAVGGRWRAALSAVGGSLALYVLGYLVLRFHLTALGVGIDVSLHLMDERYFFAGAKFLVYLVAAIPDLLILALPLAALGYGAYRALPAAARERMQRWAAGLSSTTFIWTGIVLAVLAIQIVMRRVFYFGNLLVAPTSGAAPGWLLRTACHDGRLSLYFSALVAACALSAWLLYLARARTPDGQPPAAGMLLLSLLLAIEVAFLPLTYGYLVFDKELARVGTLTGEAPLSQEQHAWLVWETERSTTYLIEQAGGRRELVTLPNSEVRRRIIVGYDSLWRRFFSDACGS